MFAEKIKLSAFSLRFLVHSVLVESGAQLKLQLYEDFISLCFRKAWRRRKFERKTFLNQKVWIRKWKKLIGFLTLWILCNLRRHYLLFARAEIARSAKWVERERLVCQQALIIFKLWKVIKNCKWKSRIKAQLGSPLKRIPFFSHKKFIVGWKILRFLKMIFPPTGLAKCRIKLSWSFHVT